MNQNENPMFPWDSSILPTAVPPFRETVTDSFLWCRRKEEIAKKAEEMAKTVKQAIETYGTNHIWGLGDVYAYEVD